MKRFRDTVFSYGTAFFIAAVAAFAIAAVAVWWGGLNQDEGWYMYAAQSVRAGRMPYRDFFFTQGPVMPFVYSRIAPLWMSWSSPLHGLLGGRLATLAFGLAGVAASVATVRLLSPRGMKAFPSFAAFCFLACNVYHAYFTSVVKTYALSLMLVMCGFAAFAAALRLRGAGGAAACAARIALFAASGLSFAFASGTRISLILIPAVAGLALFATMRRRGAAFLWFGLGLAAGLWPTYGVFAFDETSRRGLLAAQAFHAARGGFDVYNAVGSVSRLARAYLPLWGSLAAAAVFAAAGLRRKAREGGDGGAAETERLFALRTMAASFAAVFLLQLSAPFPYDDYQVPLMGIAAVVAAAALAGALPHGGFAPRVAALAVLAASGLCAFSSPLLQQWFTAGQDRFWVLRRESSPLLALSMAADEIEAIDPGGKELFTQDLYIAVESGRSVPPGFEMGPFGYFPDAPREEADALRVFNREKLLEYLETARLPRVAALSGYSFAIAAPKMGELDAKEQFEIFRLLKKRYELFGREDRFGQNDTPLMMCRLREPQAQRKAAD